MTSRTLQSSFLRDLNKQSTPEAPLVFLTISHPNLSQDILVVSDPKNFTFDSKAFIGFPFEISLFSDGANPPEARLSVQNVDKEIGTALKSLTGPLRIKIEVIALSEFDTSVEPRVPVSAPVNIEYTADQAYLINVSVDGGLVEGTIISWIYTQESWPGVRCTMARTPALWR